MTSNRSHTDFQNLPSGREVPTEFQYRPQIFDTERIKVAYVCRVNFARFFSSYEFSYEKCSETWWTFRIFFIFSARGREGGVRAPGGGRGATLYGKIPGEGVSRVGGCGGEGPGGCLRAILGGGAKYFFRGRNAHQGNFPRNV